MKKTILTSALISILFGGSAQASQETDELRKLIELQQQQLEMLKKRLDEQEQKLEITAEVVESQPTSTATQANSATTIGGYGEMHFNHTDTKDTLDFHRFVLFFGHKFNDRLRFFSELELEHSISGEGQPGEVELEQAYIEYDVTENLSAKGGLFLLPVGIMNETHEPATFYGVERNPVEKDIIPTTWWEGGAGITYRPAGGWTIDAVITSGLDVTTSGSNAYKIRNGRSKVGKAQADSFALTSRVKYTAIQGLELAASVQFQDDITQGDEAVEATLLTAHAIYQNGPFTLRALYASWDLDGAGPEAIGRDEQTGFYIEPSIKLSDKFGLFARYSEWDNEAGFGSDNEKKQTTLGLNYWLHENVVLKADWDDFSGALDGDAFNLGIGYQF